MGYSLGIDVGTTFTAAAIWRDERVEVVGLESHRVAVPTIVFASGDELAFGGAAVGRAATEPAGAAREFKRRLGDPVPLVLSGAPYSADRLVALFSQWVVGTVTEQIGEAPDRIVITHPANWTEFQLHLLTNALQQTDLGDVALLTEPQAAAVDFGAAAHLEPGQLVVVYDLGGGTFDVALLRREAVGFVHVGEPAGVERLGGIDFDEAVFQHVVGHVPPDAVAQARSDLGGRMALGQLRRSCIEAKERLSSEMAVEVPVMLPGVTSTVRLTRAEFEGMVRPMLHQTVDLVEQVLTRAGITVDELSAVLLVGGSSRIPLVSELVRQQLNAPVRVDAHPKLVVARGAARWAGALPAQGPARAAAPSGAGRRRGMLVAAAVAAAALVGGGAWLLLAGDGDDSDATGTTDVPDTSDVSVTTGAVTSTTTGATTGTTITTDPTLPGAQTVVNIEGVGTATVPGGMVVDGHSVGALSALTSDPDSGGFVALSDGRIGPVDATIFDVSIDLSDGTLDDGDVAVESATPLRNAEGQAFGEELDGEAIAFTAEDTILVMSEGTAVGPNRPTAQEPRLYEFDRAGTVVRTWPIPDWYQPVPDQTSGIHYQGGFDGLAIAGAPAQVFAAVEYTLYQDEESTDVSEPKFARILVYDEESRNAVDEYVYPLDPTSFQIPGNEFPSGLLDIVALDDGSTLLALERSLIEEPHTWRLFEVALDPSARADPSGARPPVPLTKRHLATIEVPGNFESMALGPLLPDGRRSLILVDDNEFRTDNGTPRPTTFAAYALETGPAG